MGGGVGVDGGGAWAQLVAAVEACYATWRSIGEEADRSVSAPDDAHALTALASAYEQAEVAAGVARGAGFAGGRRPNGDLTQPVGGVLDGQMSAAVGDMASAGGRPVCLRRRTWWLGAMWLPRFG